MFLSRFPLLAAALLFLGMGPVKAALISSTFNDITAGTLQGKGGGTGMSGTWGGSSTFLVEAGDLTSSLYNKPQTGPGQRVRSNNTPDIRQEFRTASTALVGEVWFSFIVREGAAVDRSGLSFNAPTASPFDNRGSAFLEFQGSGSNVNLVYRFGNAVNQTISSVVTGLGTNILVVGQMTLNGGGAADGIKVWVNPDLMANPDINSYTPVINASGLHFADSITHLGIISYRSGGTSSNGGLFDNLYLSDRPQAYFDVTGVPEPGAVALAGLSALGFGLIRRRRSRRA